MSGISIPIVTEFDGKGINKAIAQFKNLETNGEKAQFAIKKAAVPAAAALAGLAVALGDAVKGAIEDAAEQDKLAQQIKRTTGATDLQIAGIENYITAAGKQKGFTDSVLRPSMGGLVRATQDVEKAQELMTLAMDVSTAKGVPLESVTKALEKAYGGNYKALALLSPELRDMIKEGASLEDVMKELSNTFGGAASDAAQTTAGKFARMKIALDETKESIGAALMPAVEAVLPYLQKFADWAQDNPDVFLIAAGALAAIAASIVAINIAMALNPIGLIVIAVGLAIAALAIAYTKFEGFRNIVDNIFGAIKWYVVNVAVPYFQMLGDIVYKIFQGIKTAWNATVGGLSFKFPEWLKYTGPLGMLLAGKSFSIPEIGGGGGGETSSMRAFEESQKKIVTTSASSFAPPTVAASAPGTIQNTEPPVTAMPGGTGANTMAGGLAGITINLEAGLISSPGTIGQDIIEAILAAQRDSGVVFAPAVTL